MKRFAVLALAAVFAFSLSTSVYAAPEFSWELTIESKTVLASDTDVINFNGGPEASLSVAGGEEGAWNLSVQFGGIAAGGNDIEIGKYFVTVTPEPFTLSAWGGEYELSTVQDAFGFISSGKKTEPGPKYRLTTDVAGIGVTVDYDTEGADPDALYVFVDAGMIGAAFADTKVGDEVDGRVVSADVEVDLGIATVTGGVSYDLQVDPETDGALAFGIKAESEIAAGLTVNAGFKSDGRDKADPVNTIEGGAEYVFDVHTIGASVEHETQGDSTTMTIAGDYSYGDVANLGVEYVSDDTDTPTLTFTADAEYAVIPDVLTISADFEMVNDKEVGFASGDDYEWIDGTKIGGFVVSVMVLNASAEYKLTPVFTVTPGFGYASYTFETGEASATTLSVDAEYKVSDSASVTLGFENASGTAAAGNSAGIADANVTTLSTGITLNW